MTRFIAAIVVLGAALSSAHAGDAQKPTDQQLMQGYELSIDKLKSYAAATAAIAKDCRDPLLSGDLHAPENAASLQQSIDRMSHSPMYERYYQSRGLDAKDAVLMPRIALNMTRVAQGRASADEKAQASPQQIDFYRRYSRVIGGINFNGGCAAHR